MKKKSLFLTIVGLLFVLNFNVIAEDLKDYIDSEKLQNFLNNEFQISDKDLEIREYDKNEQQDPITGLNCKRITFKQQKEKELWLLVIMKIQKWVLVEAIEMQTK